MKRFNIILLCIPLVWGSPFQIGSFKSTPLKDIESRIINGEQAILGQFPWQVAMYFDGNYMWFCSGSVISEEWILTAGHCVDGAQSVRIFAGLVKLDGNVGAVSESTEFFLHEGYNSETLENDIGLVKLNKLLSFDNFLKPITLSEEILDTNVEITVSGWGTTSDDSGVISQMLNYVDLLTITNSECAKAYGDEIFDGMVCAISGSDSVKSPCSGDSGGPVVIDADTNPIHVAVVSFVSNDGCEADSPSGYTRTAFYRDWIKNKTGV
ncbi:hypothetical protein MTP99_002005 [Tenebrio molitor]|nr:hypothetical protein MTP99_002005 [Tenebrio molitor]CAH1365736.1 unnamed protein product [Tenebrio molitor]